ncbi:MAG: hypothetical protein ACOYWZ_04950 [Bacillota bacterium]
MSTESLTPIASWVFGVISVIGVILTIFYGMESKRLKKALKKMEWHDVLIFTDFLWSKLKKDKFKPDVILTPGLRGGIISEVLIGKMGHDIQVFVGISLIKDERDVNANIEGYIKLNVSDDWNIFIPKAILSFKDKNILIVDDFCLAGEFHVRLKNELINLGIPKERIRVSYAVITSVTKSSNRAPDYYWREITDDNFYFPWGKANTG